MKKSKIIIGVLSVLVVALAICIVVLVYNNQPTKDNNTQKTSTSDKVKGVYFRKLYGSIGVLKSENTTNDQSTFRTEVYAFNSNTKFLDDISKLSFDNDNVLVKDVIVADHPEKDNDLTKYVVSFKVGFSTEGKYTITNLVYKNGGKTVKYPIGKVSFNYVNGQSVDIKQGIGAEITNNEACYSFLEANKKPFTVKGLVSGDNDQFKYTYKKNVKFTPGKQLDYYIKINSNASSADSMVFSPIFEIKMDNSNKVKYLVPFTQIYGGDNNLNYDQIEEYVQNP